MTGLQETKAPDGSFAGLSIAVLGYPHQIVSGMKSHNGVAIVSRLPLGATGALTWCGKDDCRHVFLATLPEVSSSGWSYTVEADAPERPEASGPWVDAPR